MVSNFIINKKKYKADLSKPIDISIPLFAGKKNVNAFHIPDVVIEPFRMGDFIGAVNKGGSCNVNNIAFNPHGNGTHTECVGHISKKFISLNQCLTEFFFIAKLVTVKPEKQGDDLVVTRSQIEKCFSAGSGLPTPDSLIIRTLPNSQSKLTRKYSGTNPAYLDKDAALWIREKGIQHLLLDLPSVDKEMDDGKLSAHHAFWNYPKKTRMNATITEMVYVPDKVKDGNYLLNLMIASFENDASPSKPVLYSLK
ncbi:MAG: cyclase family protein [Bacteroidetes bacterium]|nr:cyclase family protein [Bacteroidota bacterium]